MRNIKLSERLTLFLETAPYAIDEAPWFVLRNLALAIRLPYSVQAKADLIKCLSPEIAHLTHVLRTANQVGRVKLAPQKSTNVTLPHALELFLCTDFTIGYDTQVVELRHMAKILHLPEAIRTKMALIDAITAELPVLEQLLATMTVPTWSHPTSQN